MYVTFGMGEARALFTACLRRVKSVNATVESLFEEMVKYDKWPNETESNRTHICLKFFRVIQAVQIT